MTGGPPSSADVRDIGGMDIDRFDDFGAGNAPGNFDQFLPQDFVSGNAWFDGSERDHLEQQLIDFVAHSW